VIEKLPFPLGDGGVMNAIDASDLHFGAISLQDFQHELELELRGVALGLVRHRFLSLFLGEKIAPLGVGALALLVDRRYGRRSPMIR
jgi:hypothetical protein